MKLCEFPGFCLTFSSFCVCQHKPSPQRYDHRPDSADSPLSCSGFGSAVFWLFHLQDVVVSQKKKANLTKREDRDNFVFNDLLCVILSEADH